MIFHIYCSNQIIYNEIRIYSNYFCFCIFVQVVLAIITLILSLVSRHYFIVLSKTRLLRKYYLIIGKKMNNHDF